jgi:hypothetical protein
MPRTEAKQEEAEWGEWGSIFVAKNVNQPISITRGQVLNP